MSKKWCNAFPSSKTIVSYKEFNEGFNAYKSSFNGNLDRTTFPERELTNNEKVLGAMHQIKISNDDGIATTSSIVDGSTGTLGEWRGPSYNTYTGGWVEIDQYTISKFKDGMCHWEYRFHYLVDVFLGNKADSSNVKYIEVKLTWDGTTVYESNRIGTPIGTCRLIADFPITGGTHVAKVFARSTPPLDSTQEVYGNNLFNIQGASHLFIGRWR
jgi:hypothetical protein